MKSDLKHTIIPNFSTESGVANKDIRLSYQLFGKPLGSSPVVLVNHALTGNSNVTGESGWWNELIGDDKVIDTKVYTILAFNIPGNGYDSFEIANYRDFVARDIANLFCWGLRLWKFRSCLPL